MSTQSESCAVEVSIARAGKAVPALPSDFRMLRWRGVSEITGLSRPGIYLAMKIDEFPRPVKIGPSQYAHSKTCAVAWLEHEVRAWMRHKVQASRALT